MEEFDTKAVEKRIGYRFKDKNLLVKAFTHSSYAHENKIEDNELLEFFGDAIIEFIVTEFLFNGHCGNEGALTQKRADIVSRQPLMDSVEKLGLSQYIRLGEGQKKTIRKDDKLISSLYEALVCAIYLDGGISPAKKFVEKTVINDFLQRNKGKRTIITKGVSKSKLQEYVQKNKLGKIEYKLIRKEGPDHSARFVVALFLENEKLCEAIGSGIKTAEAYCAEKALDYLLNKKQDGNKN